MSPTITDYLLVSFIGGGFGAVAMYSGSARSMHWAGPRAIFSWPSAIFLDRRKNAFQLGLLLHVATSVAFAPLNLLILSKIGFVAFPAALVAGAFFGLMHGLFVSLGLVWVASNQPMLPELTGALAIRSYALRRHIAYGVTVGCVIALV